MNNHFINIAKDLRQKIPNVCRSSDILPNSMYFRLEAISEEIGDIID